MQMQKAKPNKSTKTSLQSRVAFYARTATKEQNAVEKLEEAIYSYKNRLEKYPNWNIVGIYTDTGVSGSTLERPALQRLVGDCRAGKIDMVVVESSFHLARNVILLREIFEELNRLHIEIFCENNMIVPFPNKLGKHFESKAYMEQAK